MGEDVQIYLEEVERIPLLSAQEFHTLLTRAGTGDEEAQIELVNANLRLVVEIARKYIGRGAAFSDLIQEGNIGLLKAVKKFSTKGSPTFIEYAQECIEKAIERGLKELRADRGVSLDTPIDERTYESKDEYAVEGDYVEGLTLIDLVEDINTPTHFERMNRKQLAELLHEAMKHLTMTEKKILALRFGLTGGRSHSQEEVSRILKLRPESLRSIEADALKKLSSAERLRDFY